MFAFVLFFFNFVYEYVSCYSRQKNLDLIYHTKMNFCFFIIFQLPFFVQFLFLLNFLFYLIPNRSFRCSGLLNELPFLILCNFHFYFYLTSIFIQFPFFIKFPNRSLRCSGFLNELPFLILCNF